MFVLLILIHWTAIYPMDSIIRPSKNRTWLADFVFCFQGQPGDDGRPGSAGMAVSIIQTDVTRGSLLP